MYLYYDTWHNQNFPRGILIEFWKKQNKINNYLYRWVGR